MSARGMGVRAGRVGGPGAAAPMLVGLLLLLAAGSLHPRITDLRMQSGIDRMPSVENLPPVATFSTIVLGGVRGILADFLWLRALDMQDAGRYFELTPLTSWITALDPRNTDVWRHHAWNLSYNISGLMPDADDSWRWIRQGLQLLTGDGLKYNGADPAMYREISWIIGDRIGGNVEPFQIEYKRKLAEEVGAALDLRRPLPERNALLSVLGLDVESMRHFESEYGSVDWRSAQVQAFFWADRSVPWARTAKQRTFSQRSRYQSALSALLAGRVLVDLSGVAVVQVPDLEWVSGARRAIDQAFGDKLAGLPPEMHLFFLERVCLLLCAYGRTEQAEAMLADLRARFPGGSIPGTSDAFYDSMLRGIKPGYLDEMSVALVEGAWYRALRADAAGDRAAAEAARAEAVRLWRRSVGGRSDRDVQAMLGFTTPEVLQIAARLRLAAEACGGGVSSVQRE